MRRLAFLLLLVVSCGGKEEPSPFVQEALAKVIGVKVRPAQVTLVPNAQAQFATSPPKSVVWSVREATGGVIDQAGLYTAPGAAGSYHVVAASGTITGEAVVTVVSPVVITMPATFTTETCVPVQLTATVTGSSDTGVIWTSLEAGCGTVNSAGVFELLTGSGTCRIQAAAHADPTKVAVTTVTINQERVVRVAVTPATVSLVAGGTKQFAAQVTTPCGTFPAAVP